MRHAPPVLLAVETALPTGALSQEAFAGFAARLGARVPREAALLHALARQSGVERRRSVLLPTGEANGIPFYEDRDRPPTTAERMAVYEREAPPLAETAARRAIEQAGLQPRDITHLVVASCTGFFSPGLDFALIERLGLSPATKRLLVGFMGCHGALNATAQAAALAASDPQSAVLVVSVELCTLHFQPGMNRDAIVPNTLFGDGAAAWVLGGSARTNAAPAGRFRVAASESFHLGAATREKMTWRIGDTGFRMTLAADVPDLIAERVPALLAGTLALCGCTAGEVEHWAVHPGGPRVLEALESALRLPKEKLQPSRDVLAECGNLSSATVPFIWQRLVADGARGRIVSLAFGPGLVAEVTLMESAAGTESG